MESWNRKWRTLWCWSNVYVGWKVAQARGRALPQEKQAAYWEQRHEHFANLVWDNIKELKGWWVKVGQFLSTRSDLLPQQYIHHLIKLQDMMPTTPFPIIRKALEAELGDLSQIFSKIEEKALASASIGQVHRAWLADGTPVVVKVQHADVEALLMHDIANLNQLSWAFGLLEPGMNFAPILEEWQKAAGKELDFRYEFAHQQRAYAAAQRSGIDVVIPRCFPGLVTKTVFVMEFIDGFKVTDTAKLEQYGVDTRELMYKLCDSFAYQIHIDGLFNGDPHPGNILVSVDPVTKEAKPVILDWGLVKEFDAKGQTAFSKLVYSVASMDVMGLMEAFEDMGFQFKEGKGAIVDPEVYMEALRLAFRQGEVEKKETEAVQKAAGETVQAAVKAGINRKKIQEANPLEDWPKDIIFFVRVASLLHGLCVQLKVHIPFLQIMVRRAQECLFNRYQPPSPRIYTHFLGGRGVAKCSLQQRLNRLLRSLIEQKLVLGCQVAVCYEGEMIIDAAIGQMGPVDTRPVTPDSLFCGYCTTKGILSTALLQLVSSGELELDEAVSSWWDGFIRYGKRAVTVQQLLTHRAGLHRALPADLTLSRLADYGEMVRIVEDAPPACVPGALGRYAYLTYGWAVSELVRCVSGLSIDAFIQERLLEPLGLDDEIFMRFPPVHEKQAAEAAAQPSATAAAEGKAASPVLQSTIAPQQHSPSLRRRGSGSSLRAASAGGKKSLKLPPASGLRHSSLSPEKVVSPRYTPAASVVGGSEKRAAASTSAQPQSAEMNISSQSITDVHGSSGHASQHHEQLEEGNTRSSLHPGSPRLGGTKDDAQVGPGQNQDGNPNQATERSVTEKRNISNFSARFSPNLQYSDGAPSSAGGTSSRNTHGSSLDGKADGAPSSHRAPANDDPVAILSRGSGAFAERKLQLSAFPKEVEIVRANTPVLWRLTSARRKIAFNPMTQQEVLQRLQQAKGKLEAKQLNTKDGFSVTEAAQTRRCMASAVRQRRRILHNMRGNSGPIGTPKETPVYSSRSVESLPDVLPYPRTGGHSGDDRQKSEEESGFSHSDVVTEEPGTLTSDIEPPELAPPAPGAAARVSVLELIRTKPHVMDPLIYDSHRVVHQLIPPTNCRCTARALARFYSALGDGRIISKPLLDAARVAHTTDTTLEALLLTGGGSRTWGLGYQLYDCAFLSSPGLISARAGQGAHVAGALLHSRTTHTGGDFVSRRSRRILRDSTAFGYPTGASGTVPHVDAEALLRDRGLSASHPWGATLGLKPRGVVGLGHGDVGGSIAMCFPEANLSISILLNDVLTGPEASQIILEFLLRCFGLQPKWQTQVSIDEVLENLTPPVGSSTGAQS